VRGPTNGWNIFPLTASVALTNGQYCWLAIWSDDANAKVYYSDNSGTLRWGQYNYGSWPNPLATSGNGAFNYCIFAQGQGGAAPALASIAITPVNPSILTGTTQQFTATGTYSDGSAQNVTSQAAWTSSNTGVATVSAGGLASAVSTGASAISAALGGVAGSSTLTVNPAPVAIITSSLANGVAGVAYSATLTASGGTTPYAWAMAGGTLPPGLTLNSTSGVVAGTPTGTGVFSFTVNVSDASSPVQTASRTLALTIGSGLVSIWPGTAVPTLVDGGPDSAVELGVKFRSDTVGSVTGIRFYKASANTGAHIGNLWTSAGARLGTVTFTNESGSGWQQALFATPVAIASNTVYVASYHANNGHYSADVNYFSAKGVDNPPLHALANGVSGANSIYAYGGTSVFPNQTWNAANYWVDVVFQPTVVSSQLSVAAAAVNPGILAEAAQLLTGTMPGQEIYQLHEVAIVFERPTLSSNGQVRLVLHNGTGLAPTVEVSNDLLTWVRLGVLSNTAATVTFVDSISTNSPARFYRAVASPP
jgi:hypothetical protein